MNTKTILTAVALGVLAVGRAHAGTDYEAREAIDHIQRGRDSAHQIRDLRVHNSATVGGAQTVTGAQTVGSQTVTGNQTVGGDSTVTSNLTVSGTTTLDTALDGYVKTSAGVVSADADVDAEDIVWAHNHFEPGVPHSVTNGQELSTAVEVLPGRLNAIMGDGAAGTTNTVTLSNWPTAGLYRMTYVFTSVDTDKATVVIDSANLYPSGSTLVMPPGTFAMFMAGATNVIMGYTFPVTEE